MENNVCKLTLEEKTAVQNYVKHTDLSPDLKLLVYRILFLNTEAKDKCCYARNAYFAKDLGKSERTVRRHLKYLKDIDFISTTIVRKGKHIVSRVIHIAQSLVEKAIKFAKKTAQKAKAKKAHSKADGHQYGLVSNRVNLVEDVSSNEDTYTRTRAKETDSKKSSDAQDTTNSYNRESYWQLIDRKIPVFNLETSQLNGLMKQHTKQRMLFRKAPTNYALELTIDSLFNKFRSMKNRIKAVEKAVKNGWINIGGGRRNKYKKPQQAQNTTVYKDVLPDLQYNSWGDIL